MRWELGFGKNIFPFSGNYPDFDVSCFVGFLRVVRVIRGLVFQMNHEPLEPHETKLNRRNSRFDTDATGSRYSKAISYLTYISHTKYIVYAQYSIEFLPKPARASRKYYLGQDFYGRTSDQIPHRRNIAKARTISLLAVAHDRCQLYNSLASDQRPIVGCQFRHA